jgi:uncharacterized membrane protein (DUF4010 family)
VGLQAWQSAAIALAVGLLVGSERERSGHGTVPAGVRTFGVAALAGCLAALVDPVVLAATVVGAAGLVSVGYARSNDRDLGATTEVALVLTVVLGGLAATLPALAAGAGVATAIVLVSKERMHRFVREKITDVEVTDALKFFVVAFIVLPLVPHASLGPYGVIDPRRIWTLVVAVTALGWLGYVAVRMVGPRRGLPIAGLAGGFISGAATTGAMARISRNPELNRAALAAALLASVATLVQLVVVTAVADRRVAWLLAPAAVFGAVVLAAEAWWLVFRRRRSPRAPEPVRDESAGDEPAEGQPFRARPVDDEPADPAATPPRPRRDAPAWVGRRPFALIPALLLAGIITAMLVLAALAGNTFGRSGAVLTISAAGLADAHAGALTAASLSSRGTLAPGTAALGAMAAVGVNTLVKLALAFAAGGRRVCATLAALFAGPIAAVAAGLAVTLGVTG